LFVSVEAGLQALLPKPSVEVHLSLDPSTIKENQSARLTLSLKNLDLKTHQLTIVFNVNPRIQVYAGTEQLLQNYTFSLRLEASQPADERVFTMTGSLEPGISSSDYPISLNVYDNGNELNKAWDDVTLTITK
jgi:hypothetical protein